MPTDPTPNPVRAAFEAWALKNDYSLGTSYFEFYHNWLSQKAWLAWQAATSASAERVRELEAENAALREQVGGSTKPEDFDAPLHFDVQIGSVKFSKGVRFGTLVAAATRWQDGAKELSEAKAILARIGQEAVAKDAEIAKLRDALENCAEQFEFYAKEHTRANKPDKAATNQRFADLADAAILKAHNITGESQ